MLRLASFPLVKRTVLSLSFYSSASSSLIALGHLVSCINDYQSSASKNAIGRAPLKGIGAAAWIIDTTANISPSTTPNPRILDAVQRWMTETTAAIFISALRCYLLPFTCVHKSGSQRYKDSQLCSHAFHISIAWSTPRLKVSMSEMLPELVWRGSGIVYRAPFLTSFVIRCTKWQMLATMAPAHPHIPAI
ncbi:hypothetical protein ARMGADRAFT_58541 [Armillaria gallica]|uniref:Uncharacterized protein n=1 Tax=Armillaria gallica TaxID=47427 RepID=A0A2H3DHA1_ARMGA|nr:hypothetical protein ARMGADRAFT_58541 [Armillaria gallica]